MLHLGYVYTCQLYYSKTEAAAAKKVVDNWLAILSTILFIYYTKMKDFYIINE